MVDSVALCPASRKVVLGLRSGDVCVAALDEPARPMQRWHAHADAVGAVAIDDQARPGALVSAGEDGSVRFWQLDPDRRVSEARGAVSAGGRVAAVALVGSRERPFVVVATRTAGVRVVEWDAAEEAPLAVPSGEDVTAVARLGASHVVAGTSRGSVLVWRVEGWGEEAWLSRRLSEPGCVLRLSVSGSALLVERRARVSVWSVGDALGAPDPGDPATTSSPSSVSSSSSPPSPSSSATPSSSSTASASLSSLVPPCLTLEDLVDASLARVGDETVITGLSQRRKSLDVVVLDRAAEEALSPASARQRRRSLESVQVEARAWRRRGVSWAPPAVEGASGACGFIVGMVAVSPSNPMEVCVEWVGEDAR